ncbi:MAG: hypothetical protein HY537_02345 [Deltaproteobacteria bacterium]|nr:hypothetical protein [Deltaproteobacteria bacterium]
MDNRRNFQNFFPEARFQLKYLGILIGSSAIQAVITFAILYYFLRQNYLLLVKYAQLDADITALLTSELKTLTGIMMGVFVLFLAVTACIGVIFSHRVAGAIFAIKRAIHQANNGQIPDLRFRHADEFPELADGFNRLVQKLRKSA